MEHDLGMQELGVLKNGWRENDPEDESTNRVKFQLVLASAWLEGEEFSIPKTGIIKQHGVLLKI